MKITDYEKVQELLRSKEKLCILQTIFSFPYPHIITPLKKLCFSDRDMDDICFISFDEKTQKELKDAIKQVINKRIKEIEEEIERI